MNELSPTGPRAVADRFSRAERLTVRQRKNWLEILLSFETKNQYEVFDAQQQAVLRVQEVGEGAVELIKRLILGPLRPFQAEVTDLMAGAPLLRLVRPWRWIFHRLEVKATDGTAIGAIEREWSWVRRLYRIEDASGREVARLFGPMLKPWTFEIQVDGRTVGAIRKKWSGLGKELFSDADNFGVDFPELADPTLRALAFSATVLVDIVHFERAKGS